MSAKVCETEGCRRRVRAGGLAVCKPCWRQRVTQGRAQHTLPPGTPCAGCGQPGATETLELETPLGMSYAHTHRNRDCAVAAKAARAASVRCELDQVVITAHQSTLQRTLDEELDDHA